MKKIHHLINLLTCVLTTLPLISCADLSQAGYTQLDENTRLNKHLYTQPGRIYTMRGFLGVFSLGMNQLATRAQKELGINSMSVATTEWPRLSNFIIKEHKAGQLEPPLILIGHSYGADDQIKVAEELNKANITVDLLVTLDAVTPDAVPPNVKRVMNLYKSRPLTDGIPVLRGIPLTAANADKTIIQNIDFRLVDTTATADTNHFNMDDDAYIQNTILKEIRRTLIAAKSQQK